ncbi:hypothetical protein [Brevibacterium sp. UCMA 11754]|uniref:hypothetical protein n=1 Tax=Brevibacterium sp. UCMA 11754 TaxID=2749198 RepID=UPI003FA47FD7
MDLELNDIQQELASTLNKYLRSEYDTQAREAILHSEEASPARSGRRSQRWACSAWQSRRTTVEQKYLRRGCCGLGSIRRSLVLEPFLATAVLGANAIAAAGSEEQKQEILPSVCEGQTFLAFAALEARSALRVDTPSTTASTGADGAFTISGEKNGVLGRDVADQFIVTASERRTRIVPGRRDGNRSLPRHTPSGRRPGKRQREVRQRTGPSASAPPMRMPSSPRCSTPRTLRSWPKQSVSWKPR